MRPAAALAALSLSALLTAGCAGATRSSLPPGFSVVNSASVGPASEPVVIPVEGGARLRSIAVMVSGYPLRVRAVQVRYGPSADDDVLEFSIGAELSPGVATRVLDLPDRYRPVRAVALVLAPGSPPPPGPARAHLYGLR